MKGVLITLEGIDGSGKSTAAGELSSLLHELMPDRRVVLTAEPSQGEVGKILRAQLSIADETGVSTFRIVEELFLFMADHADHLSKLVRPSLDRGAIVICDRYADSTVAYQGVTLRGIVPDPLQWIRDIHRPWNLVPDKTLIFTLDPSQALKRVQSRREREKFERLEFLREVDRNFCRLAAMEPERFALIDASRSIKDVADQALAQILAVVSSQG